MEKIIAFAHRLLKEVLTSNDVAIDMTMGNGKDTLFLSGIAKTVWSFDIQDIALYNTKNLIKDCDHVHLVCDNHRHIRKYVKCGVKGVIFNLGYLPGATKEITTNHQDTLFALKEVLSFLDIGGRVVIVCYPGHLEGQKEAELLLEYTKNLSQTMYEVLVYEFINQKNNPPFLIAIERCC